MKTKEAIAIVKYDIELLSSDYEENSILSTAQRHLITIAEPKGSQDEP